MAVGRPMDRQRLEDLSPMLVLAPHPDDETLGCGGLIATACGRGLRPRVAYLTDGAASHPGSRAWPPGRLAAARADEAGQALNVLGVRREDRLFLGWPDAAPHAPGTEAYAQSVALLAAWMDSFGARSLWAPWIEETHCDHAAAAGLARAAASGAKARTVVMSYLVWGWSHLQLTRAVPRHGVWTLSCRRTVPRRRRALSCHRTQTTPLIGDAAEGFRIPPQLAALTDRPAEVFLQTP